MKIWKNALMLPLIVSLLFSAFAVVPSLAQITTLAAPDIENTLKGPLSTLSVDITVDDVEAMFGYNMYVYYDAKVLTATGVTGVYPFEYAYPYKIDDTAGFISFGFSYPPPEYTGKYCYDPESIATVTFTVDTWGSSPLDIAGSVISDIRGNPITHVAVGGSFRNVAGAPVASFTWTPESPLALEAVTFTSLSRDPGGSIASLDWNWGDGSAHGTLPEETHAYAKVGIYTVTLTVTDNTGQTDTHSRTIVVKERPPMGAVAKAVWGSQKSLDFSKYGSHKQILKVSVENIDPELDCLVRAVLIVRSVSGNNPPRRGMDFPPEWVGKKSTKMFESDAFDMLDPAWGFAGQTGPTPTRERDKQYIVIPLIYYADFFWPDGTPHWTTVPGAPEPTFTFWCHEDRAVAIMTPTRDPTDPYNLRWTFDSSASYDPDEKWGDYIAERYWYVFDQWYYNLYALTSGMTLTYDFRDSGSTETYRPTMVIGLRVVDIFGVRRTIYREIGPGADFYWAGYDSSDWGPAIVHQAVTFDCSWCWSYFSTIVSGEMDFGDGTTATVPVVDGVPGSVTHEYNKAGTYVVTLSVTDDLGLTGTTSYDLAGMYAIEVLGPHADFTWTPETPVKRQTVTFDASASYDDIPDATIASYTWDFGDGSAPVTTTAETITHLYGTAGTFTVTLTITDNFGYTDTLSKQITVLKHGS